MNRPLALLRPEPGWSASAATARAMGIEVLGHPLFRSEPLDWHLPTVHFDALLVGSAAVFAQGGPQLEQLRDFPVHAVGECTAMAARKSGFVVAQTGVGGLQSLLDSAAGKPLRFLRLGGEERVRLQPRAGQSLIEVAVYRLRPLALERALTDALTTRNPIVALHSAAAARQFAAEVDHLGIARGRLVLLALAPRIAKEAGLGWAALHIAEAPSDAALLAKAAALCE